MTLSLPRFQQSSPLVNQDGTPTDAFHIWWDTFASRLETNFNDLSTTVQALVDLNDDNTLTPAKKPLWIFMYSCITSEQSSLDAQATTYGITTEKTNYDNSISTLTTYLGTLTTPVLWNDLTGNTTVVGTTFRSNFNDVLTKKTILMNKMADKAKILADNAQSSANTAQSTANTAQSTANTAQSTANTAQTTANTAQTTANTAQSTATTAQSTANSAQSDATTAISNAAAAQSTADVATRNDSISTSWTSPGSILSATDAGSNATITIANHTRKYTDATSKSVTGASLTGLSYSTKYYIYYDQTSRAGGSVTYHAVTDPNTASYNAAAGRHFCGSITTPASGGGGTSGGVTPPGGSYSGPGEIP